MMKQYKPRPNIVYIFNIINNVTELVNIYICKITQKKKKIIPIYLYIK